MRLIDADALKKAICYNMPTRTEVNILVDAMPDAIVGCKDCKHYKDGFCYNPNTFDDGKTRGNTTPDWFCADGKRRDG